MNLNLVALILVAGSSALSVHGADGVTTSKTGLRGGKAPHRVLSEVHAASDFLEEGLPHLPSKQEDLFDDGFDLGSIMMDEEELALFEETMHDSIMDAANMEYLKYMEHDGEEIFDEMEEDEAGVE
eukprot:7566030-Ditylum_brightwellii.AAC.1